MKNKTTTSKLLGLSQEETAMLLNLTRVHWSLFECRKRDLPLEAMKKLGALLVHRNKATTLSKEKQNIAAFEQKQAKENLKREWRNNECAILLLDKKILAMERRRAEGFAALETVACLETDPLGTSTDLIKGIHYRAVSVLNKNPLFQLQTLQLKKESLEMLKKILEQNMKESKNEL